MEIGELCLTVYEKTIVSQTGWLFIILVYSITRHYALGAYHEHTILRQNLRLSFTKTYAFYTIVSTSHLSWWNLKIKVWKSLLEFWVYVHNARGLSRSRLGKDSPFIHSWKESRECRVIKGSYRMPLIVTVSVYASNTNLFKFLEGFCAQDRI